MASSASDLIIPNSENCVFCKCVYFYVGFVLGLNFSLVRPIFLRNGTVLRGFAPSSNVSFNLWGELQEFFVFRFMVLDPADTSYLYQEPVVQCLFCWLIQSCINNENFASKSSFLSQV